MPDAPASPLPPEVIALLGDDATPEGAAKRHEEFAALCLRMVGSHRPDSALGGFDYLLAAAAIRSMESEVRCIELADAEPFDNPAHTDALIEHDRLRNEYLALRNFRSLKCEKPER